MVDTKNEIWKDIPFNRNYEVSNLGNVRSKARKVPCAQGFRNKKVHYLTPRDCHGYLRAGFKTNGILKEHLVHRLVLGAFLEERPYPEWEIDHINGNKHDNRLENLEYVSSSENSKRAIHLGLQTPESLSLAQPKRKMTPEQVIEMKNQFIVENRIWGRGHNNKDFLIRYATLYNMKLGSIQNILTGRTNRFFGEDIVQTTNH